MVLTDADIGAGMPIRAALTHDNIAAENGSPPNFLTPRRRPSESRPLREEPPAFCAPSTWLRTSSSRRARQITENFVILKPFRHRRKLDLRPIPSHNPPENLCLSADHASSVDAGDPHARQILAMATLALRILPPPLLEGQHVRPARLREICRRPWLLRQKARQAWSSRRRNHQNIIEGHARPAPGQASSR